MEKYYPKVGDGLYMAQRGCGGPVAEVKRPYTVISVNDNEIIVQADECIFDPNDNYFNSLPIAIKPCNEGKKLILHWSDKICDGAWWDYKCAGGRRYPYIAYFKEGRQYYPYLD